MYLSKFHLAILFYLTSIVCSIFGFFSNFFIIITLLITFFIYLIKKLTLNLYDPMAVDKFISLSLISLFFYMLAVYQTPVNDVSSFVNVEYMSIVAKYLFGPSVLFITTKFFWEDNKNQRIFLIMLIIVNVLLILSQILTGVKTGPVLGVLHSNQMGAIAACSIGIVCIFKCYGSKHRFIGRVLIACAIICLSLSLSRGTFIALISSFLTYGILTRFSNNIKFIVTGIVFLLSLNVYISTDFNRILDSEIGSVFASTLEETSGKDVLENGRIKIWNTAITSIVKSPYVGIGLYARRSWDRELSDGRVHTLSIHNYYLAVLLEAGILGLLSILFLITGLLLILHKYKTKVATASTAFLVGVFIHQMTEVSLTTGSLMVGFLIWFTLGIGIKLSLKNKMLLNS